MTLCRVVEKNTNTLHVLSRLAILSYKKINSGFYLIPLVGRLFFVCFHVSRTTQKVKDDFRLHLWTNWL